MLVRSTTYSDPGLRRAIVVAEESKIGNDCEYRVGTRYSIYAGNPRPILRLSSSVRILWSMIRNSVSESRHMQS